MTRIKGKAIPYIFSRSSLRIKCMGLGDRVGQWCHLLVKEKHEGASVVSGSGLGKQLFLGFCFIFKAKKRYFKSVLMASAHRCHEESLQSLESEKNCDTQFCSKFSLKILMKEKGGRESDTKNFSKDLFRFILKSVSFIKLLAWERKRKCFLFLLFVRVNRFLSIFQAQNLQIILKPYMFCASHVLFSFLMSSINYCMPRCPLFLDRWW